ncbi:molybdopterin converting factor subunit 1 [Pseudomonas leptonychotis]|jgi:molybdopterin synthase sulfur carrier subunit|uniref:molybdopterin converting factor subunit 1 n=1 Tax=Pseudomonas leptonychotis TaxID=2448482 RepID=UPI0039EF4D54
MLSLHYFARYREQLGLDHEQLAWQPELTTIGALRELLVARGGCWAELTAKNLMCARNQELCNPSEPLVDGDEVAFFPPVTGG